MRRKAKQPNYPQPYNPKIVSADLAQSVGQMIFAWNYIEGALDWALNNVLENPNELHVSVRSRINGVVSKVEIINEFIKSSRHFSAAEREILHCTSGAILPYKTARDAVVHVRIGNAKDGVAPSFERNGATYETLISVEAITRLNEHLIPFQEEMFRFHSIFFLRRGARPTIHSLVRPKPKPDKLSVTPLLLHFERLPQIQAKRIALGPLPVFPPEVESAEVSQPKPKPHDGGFQKRVTT